MPRESTTPPVLDGGCGECKCRCGCGVPGFEMGETGTVSPFRTDTAGGLVEPGLSVAKGGGEARDSVA